MRLRRALVFSEHGALALARVRGRLGFSGRAGACPCLRPRATSASLGAAACLEAAHPLASHQRQRQARQDPGPKGVHEKGAGRKRGWSSCGGRRVVRPADSTDRVARAQNETSATGAIDLVPRVPKGKPGASTKKARRKEGTYRSARRRRRPVLLASPAHTSRLKDANRTVMSHYQQYQARMTSWAYAAALLEGTQYAS